MAKRMIRVTDSVEIYTIIVQPGELVQDYPFYVADLLKTGETVASATADDTATIPQAVGRGQTVTVDIAGPANGVQIPVAVTVHGSLGSLRRVALLIVGRDPFVDVAPIPPAIYLRWRGSWRADADYAPSDLVLYGGLIYLGLTGSTGAAPDISLSNWLAWAGTGGGEGGGGSGLIPDAGGSGRYAGFRMTWTGPGDDDWQVEIKGVTQ